MLQDLSRIYNKKKTEIFLKEVRKDEDEGDVPKKRCALTKTQKLSPSSHQELENFRVLCGDRHEVAKFMSKMVDRRIILGGRGLLLTRIWDLIKVI